MTLLHFRKSDPKADNPGDPKNGDVYATASVLHLPSGEVIHDFAVVHISQSGDSASVDGGYPNMASALIGAWIKAKELNAVLLVEKGGA